MELHVGADDYCVGEFLLAKVKAILVHKICAVRGLRLGFRKRWNGKLKSVEAHRSAHVAIREIEK